MEGRFMTPQEDQVSHCSFPARGLDGLQRQDMHCSPKVAPFGCVPSVQLNGGTKQPSQLLHRQKRGAASAGAQGTPMLSPFTALQALLRADWACRVLHGQSAAGGMQELRPTWLRTLPSAPGIEASTPASFPVMAVVMIPSIKSTY